VTFAQLRFLVRSDLYRYFGRVGWDLRLWTLLFGEGPKFTFWWRACRYFREKRVWGLPFFGVCWLLYQRYVYKFGISMPDRTEVGPGLYIAHCTGVVVTRRARIGRNCNLSQGVTIGVSHRGQRKGAPTIGDNVYIGAGAKIIGAVTIGNNVAIGANTVVTKDVPDNAVVVGIPGRVISDQGATEFINKIDYEGKI